MKTRPGSKSTPAATKDRSRSLKGEDLIIGCDEVAREVQQNIRVLAPGGGYVLAAVHNVQANVPPENILALYETALSAGVY